MARTTNDVMSVTKNTQGNQTRCVQSTTKRSKSGLNKFSENKNYNYFINELEYCHENIINLFHEYQDCTKVLISRNDWKNNYLTLEDFIYDSSMETIFVPISNYISHIEEVIDAVKYPAELQSSISMNSYINLIIQKLLYITDKFELEQLSAEYTLSYISDENIQTKMDLNKQFMRNIKNELYKVKEKSTSFMERS